MEPANPAQTPAPQAPTPNQTQTPPSAVTPPATPPPAAPVSTTPAETGSNSNIASPNKGKGGIKSKLPIILIVALLLIILLAAGVFFWKNMMTSSEPAPAVEETPIVEEVTPEPTPMSSTSADMSDWKTYTGSDYSFKYPNTVKVLPEDDANEINLQLSSGDIIHVITQDNSENLSSREWLENEFPVSEVSKFKDIEVAGFDSVQNNDYSATHINLGDGQILTVTFVKCDGPGCGAGIDSKAFQEILSTFQSN